MEQIYDESDHFTLLQHKSIYLDEQRHVALTYRAQLHIEPDHVAAFLAGTPATPFYCVSCG